MNREERLVKKREMITIGLVILIVLIILGKYHPLVIESIKSLKEKSTERIESLFMDCPAEMIKIKLSDGVLCREKIEQESLYSQIYDLYPKNPKGKERIYSFLESGSIEVADGILNNIYTLDRYDPIEIEDLTWEEDPYEEKYWKFLFYGLRPLRHLIYAEKITGDKVYLRKLKEISESFIDEGMNNPLAWEDYHAVAFRSMILVNTWWKLRQENLLDIKYNEKLLRSIEEHAEFLAEEEHFEQRYNHGLNEATALFLIAYNFPDLNKSKSWHNLSISRLEEGLNSLIDEDGVLIENSPYYHFYVLQKYWDIFKYSKEHNVKIAENLDKKLFQMMNYSANVIQPNLEIPMLGASLKQTIKYSKAMKEIADIYPPLLYALTQGEKGEKLQDAVFYRSTGQTIMRSEAQKDYADKTYLIFDIGQYRTEHSDLDALHFSLYSNGITLLPDSGLYTYDYQKSLKNYFHGTSAHNTVVVDGLDQRKGEPIKYDLDINKDYIRQSAYHDLYRGVIHKREISLLNHDLILIVDDLTSEKEHNYSQLFHLFPNANLTINGSTVSGEGKERDQTITIHPIDRNIKLSIRIGNETEVPSFCSEEYEKLIPCYTVSYERTGENVRFITLLEIGKKDTSLTINFENNNISIASKKGMYEIELKELDQKVTKKAGSLKKKSSEEEIFFDNGIWRALGNTTLLNKNNKLVISLAEPLEGSKKMAAIEGVNTYYSNDNVIETEIPYMANETSFKSFEQEDVIPIFGYHRVIPNNQSISSKTNEIDETKFEEQISFITSKMECNWITMRALVSFLEEETKLPKNACVLNFDDSTTYEYFYALPILEKYNIKATFYAVPGEIGVKRNRMNWEQVDKLVALGHDVQSHSYNITRGVNSEKLLSNEILFQLKESKKILEERYDLSVETFAYPLGEWNKELIRLMASTGYKVGRDTLKDNKWRDPRPITAFIGAQIMSDATKGNDNLGETNVGQFHMFYYKPELKTLNEISTDMSYNTWWQFEENYEVDRNTSFGIRTLSGIKPTKNSYGVLKFEEGNIKISSPFLVQKNDEYTIEILSSEDSISLNTRQKGYNAAIDSTRLNLEVDLSSCNKIEEKYFCTSKSKIFLVEGKHMLSVTANRKDVYLDKFRLYREITPKQRYKLKFFEEVFENEEQDKGIGSSIKSIKRLDVEKSSFFQKINALLN